MLFLLPMFVGAQQDDYSHSVLYGERAGLPNLPNTHRIFLDRNGDLYPGQTIPDSLLAGANASLAELFAQQPGLFPTAQPGFGAYQDSLLRSELAALNALAGQSTEVFALVHGFRKPFRSIQGGRTAQSEYLLLQQKIRNAAPASAKPLFLEIYWDGTYDCCFSLKAKRNREIFELFELKAQRYASAAGYRLRPLLAGIDTERLRLVGHSLGVRLLAAATFNAYSEDVPEGILTGPTPAQTTVDLCLIGPAIAGDVFERYGQRGQEERPTKDNYRLAILYNKKDFVLKKRIFIFGPGPRRFGDTSLGADRRRSIQKLTERFETEFSGSVLKTYEVDIGKSHAIRHYSGTPEFREYLAGLWE